MYLKLLQLLLLLWLSVAGGGGFATKRVWNVNDMDLGSAHGGDNWPSFLDLNTNGSGDDDNEGDEFTDAPEQQQMRLQQQPQDAKECCEPSKPGIANKAAQVATAANDAQTDAASVAAKEVKLQLADKAMAASKSVQAVLESKRQVVDIIEKDMRGLDELAGKISASLQASESHIQTTLTAFSEAECQYDKICELIKLMRHALADLEALSSMGVGDVGDKQEMLVAAKARKDRLAKKVACARNDYEQVKRAAYRAACAAVQARQKASDLEVSTADNEVVAYSHASTSRQQRQHHKTLHRRWLPPA